MVFFLYNCRLISFCFLTTAKRDGGEVGSLNDNPYPPPLIPGSRTERERWGRREVCYLLQRATADNAEYCRLHKHGGRDKSVCYGEGGGNNTIILPVNVRIHADNTTTTRAIRGERDGKQI